MSGAPAPGNLRAGTYAFRATALDSSGSETAQTCREVEIPSMQRIDLVLDGGAVCAPPSSGDDASSPLPDASSPLPSDSGPARSCGGATVADRCWYMGDLAASCTTTCEGRGGVDSGAASVIGVAAQGGSSDGCQMVLDALGYTNRVQTGVRRDALGLGCHRWVDGENWWLEDPAYDAAASITDAQRVCACLE